MPTVGPGRWREKLKKTWKMRNAYCRTWKMARKTEEKEENEKCIL
jgi:hypothetical protein